MLAAGSADTRGAGDAETSADAAAGAADDSAAGASTGAAGAADDIDVIVLSLSDWTKMSQNFQYFIFAKIQ